MDWNELPPVNSRPDFNQILAVLERRKPDRPTLFEFFMNDRFYNRLADPAVYTGQGELEKPLRMMSAFQRAGYDYYTLLLPNFSFETGAFERKASMSQNEGALVHDRASFAAYAFPDPDQLDVSLLDRLSERLPTGMKIILYGPGGVLENAISLVGYEALCTLILDDPELADDVFAAIGERLVEYYRRTASHPGIGACISNDDWGFKTQTLFSPRHMRRFVFPWHKRIVETIHQAGKPAILHSCGYFEKIIDDVIDDMKYDARHSYEDGILPVEVAYGRYGARIAILGGIDLDYVIREPHERVYQRARSMLARAEVDGGYALGTGNSAPEYLPDDKFFALIRAALDQR